MKRLLNHLFICILSVALFSGCFPAEDIENLGSGVLQGVIVDGVTGQRMSRNQVDIWIVVGSDALYADQSSGARTGDFAIYGIPQGISFPVIAQADGYMMFEGYVTLPTISKYLVGNIVLYPIGTTPGDVEIFVYDDFGTPVSPGTTVILSPDSNSVNGMVDDEFNSAYLLQSIDNIRFGEVVAVTDETGRATISGSELALGAQYTIRTLNAMDTEGLPLHQAGVPPSFVVGVDYVHQAVFLNRSVGLPVVRWINTEDGSLETNLVALFGFPISLCGDPDDMFSSFIAPDVDGDGVVSTPSNDDPIVVTLSDDGLVLTVEYNAETNDDNDPLSVVFSGIRVQAEYSNMCQLLSAVELRDSGTTLGSQNLLRINVR